jgi:hypothetical protein
VASADGGDAGGTSAAAIEQGARHRSPRPRQEPAAVTATGRTPRRRSPRPRQGLLFVVRLGYPSRSAPLSCHLLSPLSPLMDMKKMCIFGSGTMELHGYVMI